MNLILSEGEQIDEKDFMKPKPELRADVDNEGRLVLPTEIVSRYGLKPGPKFPSMKGKRLTPASLCHAPLRKVYIEPTNSLQPAMSDLHTKRLGGTVRSNGQPNLLRESSKD